MLMNHMSHRDPNSHATLKAFRQCIEWAMEGKFSDEDVNEARLSLFSKVMLCIHSDIGFLALVFVGVHFLEHEVHNYCNHMYLR